MALATILEQLESGALRQEGETEIGDGFQIQRTFIGSWVISRYWYDGHGCAGEGWAQYDTDQDFEHFGVWYHEEKQIVVTWAEGDETVVTCDTIEAWNAQIKSMNEFYGKTPAFITLGHNDQGEFEETHYFEERPTAKEVAV